LAKNNKKINREVVREKLGGGSFSTISPLVSEWKELKYKGNTNSIENSRQDANTGTIDCTDSVSESIPVRDTDNFVQSIEGNEIVPLIKERTDLESNENLSTNSTEKGTQFCTQIGDLNTESTYSVSSGDQGTVLEGIDNNSTFNQNPVSSQNPSAGEIVRIDNGEIAQNQSVDSLSSEEINDYLPEEDLNYITRSGAEKALGLLAAQDALALHFYKNPTDLPSDLKAKYLEFRRNFSQLRGTVHGKAYSPQNLINLATKQLEKSKHVSEGIGEILSSKN
ncbi:MAG: DNA-binding protein, partial [Cylindrospermopsis raciborskii PAMP2012]